METESHFEKMQELAKSGVRITDITSHDPHGLITEAAIRFASAKSTVAGEGLWPDEIRSATAKECFRFAENMLAMKRITEATSYLVGDANEWQFHIRFWHTYGPSGERLECSMRFETDLQRAIAHASEIKAITDASDKFGSEPEKSNATIKDRTESI